MAIDWNDADFVYLRRQLGLGRVSLFLGAGFSFDSKNGRGERPPLGDSLAAELAEQAGFPFDGEKLPTVYEACQRQMGSLQLWAFLRERYDIISFDDWYKIVRAISWYRIYSLNIDNLVQKLYQRDANQKLHTIVNPAPIEERDVLFGTLQCIHLHGHVEHADKGLSFTLPDFGNLTSTPNPWYQTFIDDYSNRSVIFIGTQLEEPMFYHYLHLRDLKDRGVAEFRPKSYLVNPTIGKMRANTLRERNIVSVECTGKEFFDSLAAAIDLSILSLASVRHEAYPHAIFRSEKAVLDEDINRYFDLIVPGYLPFTRKSPPDNFFMGAEPDWYDINEARDAERTINENIRANLSLDRTTFSMVVLHGPAGSGVTTSMMRAAHTLASEGAQVYYAKGLERTDLASILDLADDSPDKRVFILLDVLKRYLSALDAVHVRLQNAKNVTVIVAERSNRYAQVSHALVDFNPIEIRMPDLDEADAKAIIGRLEKFGFLGVLRKKSAEERVRAFMERADKQLLVALREATSGQGFDAILRTEFFELASAAQMAYTICCIAVAHGAPGVYLRHLLPCLGRAEFTKGVVIRDLLRGVLVPANHEGTMVKPRHRLIGYWVATEIAPVGVKQEAISKFLQQISSDIVPNEIKRRSPAYLAYRGMINSEALKETFANDHEIILALYEELKACYDRDFLFWLQYGMAQMNAGHLDVAENYLNQSMGIYPYSHQVKNKLGCLCLMKATQSLNPVTAVDQANKGIELLREQIQAEGDDDSYPYHAYLVYVTRWYQKANTMISQKQWEDLRVVGNEARRKYPRDDMVRDASNEVERQYMLRVAVDRLD
jgi:tetratricopeptide (TPR) repeat protein